MEQVIVSVVLPVYNAKGYVRRALDSVLRQSFRDLEVVVVDDGSADGSLAEVEACDDMRVSIIRGDGNKGYGTAMAAGVRAARGQFIARMDADDVSHPRRIEAQVRFLQEHPEFGFVGCTTILLSPFGRRLPVKRNVPFTKRWVEETWESVYEGRRRFADSTVLVRKQLVDAVGGWRNYQRSGMDVDLWLRILETGSRGATLLSPLYFRRLIASGLVFSENTAAKNVAVRRLARERVETGEDAVMRGERPESPVLQGDWKSSQGNARFHLSIGAQCAAKGDFRGAWDFAVNGLRRGHWRMVVDRSMARFVAGLLRGIGRLGRIQAWRALRNARGWMRGVVAAFAKAVV